MGWLHTLYALALMVVAGISTALSVYAWRRRSMPGGAWFAALMAAAAVWTAAAILEMAAPDQAGKVFCAQLEYIGIVSIGPCWTLFALQHTGRIRRPSRALIAGLWAVPLVVLLLVWTNRWHGLAWPYITPSRAATWWLLDYHHGPAVWALAAYSYVLLVLGGVLVVASAVRSVRQRQREAIVLIAAVVIPLIGNVLYLAEAFPLPGIDFTPLAFCLSGALVTWSVFRLHLLGSVPLTLRTLLDTMSDAVLLIDAEGRVAGVNRAARSLLDLPESAIGCYAEEAMSTWPTLARYCLSTEDSHTEVMLDDSTTAQWFDVRVSAMHDRKGRLTGRVTVLRDFTARQRDQESLSEHARRLASLLDAAHALAVRPNPRLQLESAARSAADALDSPVAYVYECDASAEQLIARARYGPRDEGRAEPVGRSVRIAKRFDRPEHFLKGHAVEEHVSDERLSAERRAAMRESGERTVLSVPIAYRGEMLGALVLIETERERRFVPEERSLLRGFAEQVAVALRNAQLIESLQRQLTARQDLLALTGELLTTDEESDVFDRIATSLAQLIDFDAVDIGVEDPDAGEFHVEFAAGRQAESARERRLPLGAGVTGAVAASGVAEMVDDMPSDPRFCPPDGMTVDRYASILAPFEFGDRRAVLTVSRFGERRFGTGDLETVQLFTNIAAVALRNARLHRRVSEQAISDGLTGLYNHRHFYERLEQETARADRTGQPLALLMADIDDFKRLNDAHGHPAGDEVLRTIGEILRTTVRHGVDTPARYGGEEFAILLPGALALQSPDAVDKAAPDGSALAVAERIRAAVAAARFHDLADGDAFVRVTVSIGVAVYPLTADSMDELVAQADAALYVAKRRGKNRVEAYGTR